MPGKIIEHFTHPGHLLVETCSKTHYLCDGCKTPGQGTRYRCSNTGCDFDLHTFCGTCSPGNGSGGGLISSFMHPQHPLKLVVRKAHGMRLNERICKVCGDQVEGLFYTCKDCDFNLHPLCTQLPQYLNHPLHQLHSLKLESYSSLESPPGSSQCVVCRGACTSWRYGCQSCGFNIHLECILALCDDININPPTQRSPIPAGGPTPPPSYPPPLNYGASPNYSYDPYGTNYNPHNIYNHTNQAQGNSTILPPCYPPPRYGACTNHNYSPYSANYSPHNKYNHANQTQGSGSTLPPYPPWPYGASPSCNYGPYDTNYYHHNIYNYANEAQGSGITPPPSYPLPPYGVSNYGSYSTNYSPHNIYNHANQAQESGAMSGRLRLGESICRFVERLVAGVLIFNSPDIICSFLG